jgi:hypothetical protein
MMQQEQTQRAGVHEVKRAANPAAAAPAPAGYVRAATLQHLQDERIHGIGLAVFKSPAAGCVAIFTAAVSTWTPVAERLPDDETLVLIALNDDADVWTGFRDAGIWRYPDGMPIAEERVTHWSPMPVGPGAAA